MFVLLAAALAEPMAAMECSSVRDLDATLGLAETARVLAEEFPEHAEELSVWSMEGLAANGIDVEQATGWEFEAIDGETRFRWWVSVTDQAAFKEFGKALVEGRIAQGQGVVVDSEGDLGTIELVATIQDVELWWEEGQVDRMMDLAEPEPGCRLAIGVGDAGALLAQAGSLESGAGILLQYFSQRPDEVLVVVHSEGMPEELAALEGHSPVRRRRVTGNWHPTVTARANVDLQMVLELVMETAGGLVGEGGADQLFGMLEESGLELAPGAELAAEIRMEEGTIRVLAAVPLKRPRRARWVVRRLAQEPGAGRYDRGVLEMNLNGKITFIGSSGRHLIVGNGWQDVMDATHGHGRDLVTHPWSRSPGLYIGVHDASVLSGVGSLGLDVSGGLDVPAAANSGGAVLVNVQGETVTLRLSLPGLNSIMGEALVTAGRERLAPPQPEISDLTVAASSEHLAVLMLIRESQLRAIEETGAPVAYAGGPRPMDELNAEAVPWEGLPGTDFSGVVTACRYEVDVIEDGWTARTICDEDEDGNRAIYVTSGEALPYRLTPPAVR